MMPPVVSALLAFVATLFRSRESLRLEHLALRHQLAVYQQTVHRPRLRPTDRLLWAWLSRLWPGWQVGLKFVQPRTVIAWQQKRFRDHWRRLSQSGQPGRPTLAKELRDLIREMSQANPTWGSPRIVGELRKLGIDIAKSTVEKYRVQPCKPPSPTWKTFLKNHVQDLVSLDFFVVPTMTYKILFVLVILAHERRRVVHVVDGAAGSRRVSLGRGAALSLAGSRSRVWHTIPEAGPQHGHRRSPDRPAEPMAESLRGAAHREYPS
jgi:putative transposase